MEQATAPKTATRDTTSGNGKPAKTFDVHNPADGSVVAGVPDQGAAEVAAAVARVRAAQPTWEQLGHEGRYRWLGSFRDWILDNSESIADILQSETGKVRQESGMETPFLADTINFYGRNSARFLADEEHQPHSPLMKTKALKVVYRPQPVVGVIAPWNFPLMLSLGDAIPALAAGCAVVIKPSEFTPLALMEIVRGWKDEVGGPDVLDVVTGLGDTGAALVDEVLVMDDGSTDATAEEARRAGARTRENAPRHGLRAQALFARLRPPRAPRRLRLRADRSRRRRWRNSFAMPGGQGVPISKRWRRRARGFQARGSGHLPHGARRAASRWGRGRRE